MPEMVIALRVVVASKADFRLEILLAELDTHSIGVPRLAEVHEIVTAPRKLELEAHELATTALKHNDHELQQYERQDTQASACLFEHPEEVHLRSGLTHAARQSVLYPHRVQVQVLARL